MIRDESAWCEGVHSPIDYDSPDEILMRKEEPERCRDGRLLAVLEYWTGKDGRSCEEIADELGVSRQAFHNDVLALATALNLPLMRRRLREEKAAARLGTGATADDDELSKQGRGVNQEGEGDDRIS